MTGPPNPRPGHPRRAEENAEGIAEPAGQEVPPDDPAASEEDPGDDYEPL